MPEPFNGWMILALQAVFAIITIEQLRRRVFPSVGAIREPELMLDVWLPLVLVLPMLLVGWRVRTNVMHDGWIAVGGPAFAGIIAVATSCFAQERNEPGQAARWAPGQLAAWVGCAALVLLLAAARDLTLWMGQCCLALGAVVLWLSTPELSESAAAEDSAAMREAHRSVGLGLTVCLLAALGQGVGAASVPPPLAPLSGAITLASVAMALASAAGIAGSRITIRIGGWACVHGTLFSLGVMSLAQLLPRALDVVAQGEARPLERIAGGFGPLAWEGVATLVAISVAVSTGRYGPRWRIVTGAAMLLAAAILAGWRLAA